MKKISAILLGIAMLGCVPAQNAISESTSGNSISITNNPSTPLVNGLPDFSAIYDKVGKSVVNISTTQDIAVNNQYPPLTGDPFFDQFFKRMVPQQQQKQKQRGLGSGFIISNDGYILTNAHVVDKADTVTVRLSDKREFKAKIIGVDTITDVAVLKITANNLSPVIIGNPSKLKSGNWVVAIGSPFGLENTITHGIVSALSRNLPDDKTVPFIQTDVPVNPGNSGGPLINLSGEVVGINSQIYSRSGGYMGISFAIPIDYAMRIAEQIKTTGKALHGRLGVTIQPVTDELAPSFGLKSAKGMLVNGVEANSAASKAGIEVGDIILQANGQDVSDGNSLPALISNLGPNKPVTLTIWRNNKELTLNATTMAAENANASDDNNGAASDTQTGKIEQLGLLVAPLTNEQIKQLGVKISGGLLVKQVADSAQYAGLQPNDVIIGTANAPITSIAQLQHLASKAKAGQSVVLKVMRSNGMMTMTMFIAVPVVAAK